MSDAISDEVLGRTLRTYARVAAGLLRDPESWVDDEPASRLHAAMRAVRRGLPGDVHPGSPDWPQQPVARRYEWWVDRISAVAAPVSATPRVFGLLADRLPVQAAFGTAAAGLAVCAVAWEHRSDMNRSDINGSDINDLADPDAWVPLLGRVLFDRELTAPGADAPTVPQETDVPRPDGIVRRGARAMWKLTTVLLAASDLFDHRPRGAWVFRAVGKVPVVGLLGGMLDERGGVRRAAERTARLLAQGEPNR